MLLELESATASCVSAPAAPILSKRTIVPASTAGFQGHFAFTAATTCSPSFCTSSSCCMRSSAFSGSSP
eukprot:9567033-Alexandrium_andersonii.AAC.1